MFEKIVLKPELDINEPKVYTGREIFEGAYIDPCEELEYPPVALSMGKNYGYDIPIGTYGNFSCLVAASKSKKTFLKSLFAASYLAGQTGYGSEIIGHREDKYLIDLDTEQGEWHASKTFKRVVEMNGEGSEKYKCFALRRYTPKERVQFIDWLYYESEFKNKIGLMSIDGVADLANDVNDLKESNMIMQKFLTWTDESQSHILTILHKNFGSEKPTGHLGSAILKKCETALFLSQDEQDKDYVNVECKYSRGYSISDFSFRIDENGLPMLRDDYNINYPSDQFKNTHNPETFM